LLQCVVPTLTQRLAQPEITEPSEELRLKLVELMHSMISRCDVRVAPYLDELVFIYLLRKLYLQYIQLEMYKNTELKGSVLLLSTSPRISQCQQRF